MKIAVKVHLLPAMDSRSSFWPSSKQAGRHPLQKGNGIFIFIFGVPWNQQSWARQWDLGKDLIRRKSRRFWRKPGVEHAYFHLNSLALEEINHLQAVSPCLCLIPWFNVSNHRNERSSPEVQLKPFHYFSVYCYSSANGYRGPHQLHLQIWEGLKDVGFHSSVWFLASV